MKKYMAIFLATPASSKKWDSLDEKSRQAQEKKGMAAWGAWAQKSQKSIVSMGAPLGKTKQVNERGVSDTKNELTAYTVVEAESHEEAAKIFLNHPHFSVFPGDRVEVMECLPIPGTNS